MDIFSSTLADHDIVFDEDAKKILEKALHQVMTSDKSLHGGLSNESLVNSVSSSTQTNFGMKDTMDQKKFMSRKIEGLRTKLAQREDRIRTFAQSVKDQINSMQA
jgi:hypothetical protein